MRYSTEICPETPVTLDRNALEFDTTGKVVLDHVYSQCDPRSYFSAMKQLKYRIPQEAAPYLSQLINDYRRATGVARPTVLDVGCSYGVNALLHAYDLGLDALYTRYANEHCQLLSRAQVLRSDRELMETLRREDTPRFIGLDCSREALNYADDAGILDGYLHADFENHAPNRQQQALLSHTDLVISTGCIGYVTEKTLKRIILNAVRRPWMGHFVLRMFDYEPIARQLSELGYQTARVGVPVRQRRFASAEERQGVLETLDNVGVDPSGLEDQGWFYAQLYVSKPRQAEGCELFNRGELLTW